MRSPSIVRMYRCIGTCISKMQSSALLVSKVNIYFGRPMVSASRGNVRTFACKFNSYLNMSSCIILPLLSMWLPLCFFQVGIRQSIPSQLRVALRSHRSYTAAIPL